MAKNEVSPVLELITHRVITKSKPNLRQENPSRKLGLVIEGGALRGVISGGMVNGLQTLLGEEIPFDAMYLSSSGGGAGTYFAAGQTDIGTSIYYDELRDRRFLNIFNLLLGNPPCDIPYMIEVVCGDNSPKRLDLDRVLDYPIPIHIYGTDVETAQPYDFYPFTDRWDLRKSLEASMHLPIYGGPPVEHRGRRFVDSAISVGKVPIRQALEDECTDILALWTSKKMPISYQHPLTELPIPPLLRRSYPVLAANYWTGHTIHRETIRLREKSQQNLWKEGNLEVMQIDDSLLSINSTETNAWKLYRGAVAGRDLVLSRFANLGLIPDPEVKLLLPSYQ